MWFLLSIAALLSWSASEFFAKIGSHPRDKYSHWKMVMAVGLVMGLHAAYEMLFGGVAVTFSDMLAYLPASAMYIGSMVLGYIGLRYIEVSVSSPICNCSGAVAAILCFLFLQQLPPVLGWVGVVLIAVGMLTLGLVERRESEEAKLVRREGAIQYIASPLALLLPLLYCLIDALGTFIDAVILREEETGTFFDAMPALAEEVANVCYELTFLGMAVFAAVYVFLIKKAPLIPKSEITVGGEVLSREEFMEKEGLTPKKYLLRYELPKLGAGIFETAGQFAYVFALADTAHVGFSAAIISCYCALTVLVSRFLLKEKLTLLHYLAIAVAVAGIVILGVCDP